MDYIGTSKYVCKTSNQYVIVNNIKVGCQISRIKRVIEKHKDQDKEVVKFDGHVTSSKYYFIGYDIQHNYYNVSEDWVEWGRRSVPCRKPVKTPPSSP